MEDDLIRYNQERWDALARAEVEYARPMLDLTPETARQVVDEQGLLGEVLGKDVLCLASGGGQQSAAFALLGARVTVIDLSGEQLARDRLAAKHYGLELQAVQGDMRDLSAFPDEAFDVVWQAHSINFIPDPRPVFAEVSRVLRPGGLYRIQCQNPFIMGTNETDWNGKGYSVRWVYEDGEVVFDDPDWTFTGPDGQPQRVEGPREFRHTLHRTVNGMIAQGLELLGVWEELSQDPQAAPGTWEHFKKFAPPWLTYWAKKRGTRYSAHSNAPEGQG